jgi:hypothetical protein
MMVQVAVIASFLAVFHSLPEIDGPSSQGSLAVPYCRGGGGLQSLGSSNGTSDARWVGHDQGRLVTHLLAIWKMTALP